MAQPFSISGPEQEAGPLGLVGWAGFPNLPVPQLRLTAETGSWAGLEALRKPIRLRDPFSGPSLSREGLELSVLGTHSPILLGK